MTAPIIISLCDYSGRWSDPYRQAGYDVRQIDLKHGDDARLMKRINAPIRGILCAPVCTEFSAAGARWWKGKAEQGDKALLDGLGLVDACLRIVAVHNPDWWVLENPVGRLRDWIGQADYGFHPNEFAGWLPGAERDVEAYTKKTMLWGEFVEPEKRPVVPVLGSKMWSKYGGANGDEGKTQRSMTPRGFARAFFEANP